jgi:hypothetical protein
MSTHGSRRRGVTVADVAQAAHVCAESGLAFAEDLVRLNAGDAESLRRITQEVLRLG